MSQATVGDIRRAIENLPDAAVVLVDGKPVGAAKAGDARGDSQLGCLELSTATRTPETRPEVKTPEPKTPEVKVEPKTEEKPVDKTHHGGRAADPRHGRGRGA